MQLAPDQANATMAYYAWRCMQLEGMNATLQRVADDRQQELDRAKRQIEDLQLQVKLLGKKQDLANEVARAQAAIAPRPGATDPGTEGGATD